MRSSPRLGTSRRVSRPNSRRLRYFSTEFAAGLQELDCSIRRGWTQVHVALGRRLGLVPELHSPARHAWPGANRKCRRMCTPGFTLAWRAVCNHAGCNASPSAQCPESRLEVGSGYLLVGRRRRLYLVNQHGNITDLRSLSGRARRITSHAGRLGRHRPDRHHGQSRMYMGRALGERVDHAGRFDERSGRGEPRLLGGRQYPGHHSPRLGGRQRLTN
jgi:hypothetical protein